MSIHTLMIFSYQQHRYPALQWGCRCYQVAACVSQYIWARRLSVCESVWASSVSVIFPSTPVTLPYTSPFRLPSLALPPNTTSPATLHHLLPLWSVSLPQDLSSDWDGMFQGYTLPSANEFLNQFMEPPPPMPLLPLPLSVSPPSLHLLLLLCLSPCSLSLLQLESYLFPCLQEWILPLPSPCALSPPLTSLSPLDSALPPLPLLHPSSPNTTCSHRCVAPIYGFITAAIRGRRKGESGRKEGWRETTGEETWDMREGRQRELTW